MLEDILNASISLTAPKCFQEDFCGVPAIFIGRSKNVSPGEITPDWYPASTLAPLTVDPGTRSEEHTSELQSRFDLVCRLLLEKKKSSTMNTKLNMLKN